MNLKDIKSGGKPTCGPTKMTLISFDKVDGTYGPQLLFNFKAGETKEGKDILYKFWYALSKNFDEDRASLFLNNLQEWVKVRQVTDPNAYAFFQQLKENSEDFDNNDIDSVQNYQYKFIKALVEDAVGQEMDVIRHFNLNNEYMSIPTLKENDWNIPFGKDPVMGSGLRTTQVKAQTTPVAASDDTW